MLDSFNVQSDVKTNSVVYSFMRLMTYIEREREREKERETHTHTHTHAHSYVCHHFVSDVLVRPCQL